MTTEKKKYLWKRVRDFVAKPEMMYTRTEKASSFTSSDGQNQPGETTPLVGA